MVIGKKADNLRDGVQIAAQTIDSGKARQTLAQLVAVSNG
jgi:anthranilate phosphoribosyltransferase